MVDLFASNPLAELAEAMDPRRYAEVASVLDPPKLFANGTADYPAFTASGIDPRELLKLPFGMRHAVAAEPDINAVYRYFEDYANIEADFGSATLEHPGLEDAKRRMAAWLDSDVEAMRDARTEEEKQADFDREYAQFYSPESDRLSHAAEQKRREGQGLEPLPDFDELKRERLVREMFNRSSAVGEG